MDLSKYKIKIVPFIGNNFVRNENELIGKIILFEPLTADGRNNVTLIENNIDYNSTGFIAYCSNVLNGCGIEMKTKDGLIYGKFDGVKSIYDKSPDFIFGDFVETLNGTNRKGYIIQLLWHGNDKEFKYFIKDQTGKKITRQYSSKDLKIGEY